MLGVVVCCGTASQSEAGEPCRIQVLDDQNGWPVPLVELTTTHHVRFVSDNNGVIAFDLPELMGVETWFSVEGHGYGVTQDGFGFSGVRLIPESGQTLTVRVHRRLPAKRLGRITGGGLFAESQKLGDELDWKEQGLLGCDSVQNAVHDGRLFWGWGDTVLPGYPLGRYHMAGATTRIQPLGSFEPPVRLRYDYFTDDRGTPREVARIAGDGPTWLGGYVSLPDSNGIFRLGATYSKIEPPLTEYERGLCVWNDSEQRFEKQQTIWTRSKSSRTAPVTPHGHAVWWTDPSGQDWILFGDPFPTLRCAARFEAWADPTQWEPLEAQPNVKAEDSDRRVRPHRGAIAWNAFLKRWVSVFTELHGEESELGEIWLATAPEPTGPWSNAVKVVTHRNYSFYNPQLHPEFAASDSPILPFEATYTHTFSKSAAPTPRHDYNQVLYRLDLNENWLKR
ncbi:MAG: hypothetical protein R3C49_16290 [Planctomycetaceae bacterium]